jgi:hypothetical protein
MFARFLVAMALAGASSGIIGKIAFGGTAKGWKENLWHRESRLP